MTIRKLGKNDLRKAIGEYISNHSLEQVYTEDIVDITIQTEESKIVLSDYFEDEFNIDVEVF